MTEPSRRDRTRPLELVGLSAILAVFVGVVALLSTREWLLSLIFLGVAFILSLVTLAMLTLAMRPTGEEQLDLSEQDEEGDERRRGH